MVTGHFHDGGGGNIRHTRRETRAGGREGADPGEENRNRRESSNRPQSDDVGVSRPTTILRPSTRLISQLSTTQPPALPLPSLLQSPNQPTRINIENNPGNSNNKSISVRRKRNQQATRNTTTKSNKEREEKKKEPEYSKKKS